MTEVDGVGIPMEGIINNHGLSLLFLHEWKQFSLKMVFNFSFFFSKVDNLEMNINCLPEVRNEKISFKILNKGKIVIL